MAIFNLFHGEPSQQKLDEQAIHRKLSDDKFQLI